MCASIKMVSLTMSDLRIIAKKRNEDGYRGMSKKESEDVLSKKPNFLPRP